MEKRLEEQQQRMSTLGEMAAVLAHEIKNPMNSIIINLEVLKSLLRTALDEQNSPHSEKAEKYLDVIDREMKRLDVVIKGFLDLAAPPKKTKSAFNLNDLMSANSELLKLELDQQGVEIETDFDSNLPAFMGNADQIRQAILNLMLNAAQAMPNGGSLRLKTCADQKFIKILIKDTGEGIQESIRTKIFSPYFTTKTKGSGLGLAIVRRIMREHGGYIDFESTEGEGTEFILVFPRNDLPPIEKRYV